VAPPPRPWPLYLLVLHGSLITVGYAQAANDGVLHQFGQLLWTYPGVLAATVGGVLLIAAGVTPYRLAWRRMAFETWWSVHLALSFGAVLALPQVILEAYPPGVALFFFSVVASSVFAFVVIAGAYLRVAGRALTLLPAAPPSRLCSPAEASRSRFRSEIRCGGFSAPMTEPSLGSPSSW
jgi:hypothetical protein